MARSEQKGSQCIKKAGNCSLRSWRFGVRFQLETHTKPPATQARNWSSGKTVF